MIKRPISPRSAVFIVPLAGSGGMRDQIIDGWTWGLPIVGTTISAGGVAAEHGVNLLLADDRRLCTRRRRSVVDPALNQGLPQADAALC